MSVLQDDTLVSLLLKMFFLLIISKRNIFLFKKQPSSSLSGATIDPASETKAGGFWLWLLSHCQSSQLISRSSVSSKDCWSQRASSSCPVGAALEVTIGGDCHYLHV